MLGQYVSDFTKVQWWRANRIDFIVAEEIAWPSSAITCKYKKAIPGIGTSGGVTIIREDHAGKDLAFLQMEMGYDYMGVSYQEKKAPAGVPPMVVFGSSLRCVFLILRSRLIGFLLRRGFTARRIPL
jgi:hypothetical protein